MLKTPAVSLVLGLCAIAAQADTTFYRGRTEYILVTTAKTWDQAEADAVAKGGHLLQIDDLSENAFVLSKLAGKVTSTAADGGNAAYVWIGGTESIEGTYSWAGGSAFWSGGSNGSAIGGAYQNWGRLVSPLGGPEPDNYLAIQNRTAFAMEKWPVGATTGQEIGVAGQWNDINNSNALFYVVERPITKPSEGLFAVFTMSHGGNPVGTFTCQLHYDKTPKTVANFVSLVEGTRTWIDAPHGKVSQAPFYDGLKFHRIIPNFMIQGGDPNGNGSGGPGYRFVDEFHPDLRHDHLGVLSMANSGLNTNGSQFFVTVSTPGHLDDVHSVFGHVVEGYESCVLPLSNVATNTSNAPLQDVVISNIAIQRLGTAAQAFNPLDPAHALPVCSMQQLSIERAAGQMTLRWPEPAHVSYVLLDSPDLQTWQDQSFDYYSGFSPTSSQSLNVTNVPLPGAPRHFFQMAKITYQPLMPASLQGRTLVLTGERFGITTTMTLATANGGTHLTQGAGFNLNSVLSQVVWSEEHHDEISFLSDINPPMMVGSTALTHSDWTFVFRSSQGGSYSGGYYTADRSAYLQEYGEFTISPPAP